MNCMFPEKKCRSISELTCDRCSKSFCHDHRHMLSTFACFVCGNVFCESLRESVGVKDSGGFDVCVECHFSLAATHQFFDQQPGTTNKHVSNIPWN
jgi:hypothetical protein